MKKFRIFLPTFLLLIIFHLGGYSQPTVSGASCVMPGVVYQYNISGNWNSTSTMQVCLSGGAMLNSSNSCTPNAAPVSFIQIIWNNSSSGSIQISSSSGNAKMNVTIASVLNGGAISSVGASQVIGYDSVPNIINCTSSSGGTCSPVYNYQWQQSYNILSWIDVKGATGQNLILSSTLKQTTFFRRKVTEVSSSSIAYSDIALVDVHAPPPTIVSLNRVTIGKLRDLAFNLCASNIKLF